MKLYSLSPSKTTFPLLPPNSSPFTQSLQLSRHLKLPNTPAIQLFKVTRSASKKSQPKIPFLKHSKFNQQPTDSKLSCESFRRNTGLTMERVDWRAILYKSFLYLSMVLKFTSIPLFSSIHLACFFPPHLTGLTRKDSLMAAIFANVASDLR